MAQSSAAPPIQPRRYRVDHHYLVEGNNSSETPNMHSARFGEADWEARDVSFSAP